MYSAIEIPSGTGSSPAKKTLWPLTLSIGCLGLLLFLIAATIVLALIPIYLSNRSVSVNANAFKSKDITMLLGIEGTSSRRRRSTGDLTNAIGGTLTSDGDDQIKQKLLAMLPTGIVSDLVVISCTFGYQGSTRRKRWRLSKRAAKSYQQFVLIIKFYIIYRTSCSEKCEAANGGTLQSALEDAPKNTVFDALQIVKDGEILGFTIQIIVTEVLYISEIVSASDTAIEGTVPPVIIEIIATEFVVPTISSVVSPTPSLG